MKIGDDVGALKRKSQFFSIATYLPTGGSTMASQTIFGRIIKN